jgi:hypothetical protein
MRKTAQDLGFTHELFLQFLGAESVAESLERDDAVDEGITRFIDAAGSADTDRAYDLVASLSHF